MSKSLYSFQRAFRSLDEVTVPDPLGMGTRWTIRRGGSLDEESETKKLLGPMLDAMGPLMMLTNLPRKLQRKLDASGGITDLIVQSGRGLSMAELMDEAAVIDAAVRRVSGIEPIEMLDDATGEMRRVPFSEERAREILTLTNPVPPDVVRAALPLDEAKVPEDPDDAEDYRAAHRAKAQAATTLGRVLRAWVIAVSDDAERYREEVVNEAGESSGRGPSGSPATPRTSATTSPNHSNGA